MTALSVNLNKVALIRNTRSNGIPSVLHAAQIALEAGADGITVHPRPDGRHVRAPDVAELAALMRHWPAAEFNVEGNPSHGLLDYVQQVRPQQCTFVPDESGAFTSDHGWNLPAQIEELRPMIEQAKSLGVRVSLFMDPLPEAMDACRHCGCGSGRVVYGAVRTGVRNAGADAVLARYTAAAEAALRVGVGINAGHDLNRDNLAAFLSAVPGVSEVSIGHALIADSLEFGLGPTVRLYQAEIRKAQVGLRASMIFGVGIDIIEIDRIAASYATLWRALRAPNPGRTRVRAL